MIPQSSPRVLSNRMLGARATSRENNFDALRLVAASLVLFSHSFPLSGHLEPIVLGSTLGGLGLKMFFAISGFLVAKSWFTDPRLRAYVLKRAVRIMPGLLACALVTAFVIGSIFTTLSEGTYLTSAGVYEFLARNLTLFTIDLDLPGVFYDNAVAGAANGSLWTLPLEVCCYGMLGILGVIGLLRRPWVTVGLLLVLLVATSPFSGIDLNVSSVPGGVDGGKFQLAAQVVAVFIAGMGAYLYRDRIPLSPLLFAGAVAAYLLSHRSDLFPTVSILAVPYMVLFLAYWRPSRIAQVVTRPGDVSYGIYIYAYPVQQSVAAVWGGTFSPIVMIALAFPIAYGLALASWQLVEHPALRLKHRRVRSAFTAPAAA